MHPIDVAMDENKVAVRQQRQSWSLMPVAAVVGDDGNGNRDV